MFFTKKFYSFLFLFVALQSQAQPAVQPVRKPPQELQDLFLDLNSQEYRDTRKILSQRFSIFNEVPDVEGEAEVQKALKMGERLLKWLEYMNSFRSDADKIRLTNRKDGLRGIPIDQPSRYSPKLIKEAYLANLQKLDPVSKDVLLEGKDFPHDPGIPLDAFIIIAKGVDRTYQTASRWRMLGPYRDYYSQRAPQDVRGYYYLGREKNLANTLSQFSDLKPEDQTRLSKYLVGLCRNSEQSVNDCRADLQNSVSQKNVLAFYNSHIEAGRENWRSFFDISSLRRDMKWFQGPSPSLTIPFREHKNTVYTDFVRKNVEEEFQWQGFRLSFDLKPNLSFGSFPYVDFQPGVTPHVEGLAGNRIVMDSNSPLTEWDVQWTIRHEFGHVLGLPDCYFEFYDTEVEEMVNYQLDTTDLMCSRAGRMNQRIFDELKRAYGPNGL